ncbi:MFS domain-containing protein [Trichoderma simmonsii]|uniref:MFS domain-containing protein n=1 Tax=Trichoderma simmonsii TaxID=1491479 RepID=A0A8G0L430_9HYPO|nr:MFS domain-containing protein [Trichoderma simmonsii]
MSIQMSQTYKSPGSSDGGEFFLSSPDTDNNQVAGTDPAPSPRQIHGLSWVMVVIAILSSIFLYALDNTVVADVTPAAVNDLGDIAELPWLSVGFLLGGTAVVLPFGRLYGLFNAKWLYILSSVLFNIGSALCGAAPTMKALIIGRVLAGMGGNGMYLGAMTLLSVNTSDKERPGYLSFVGLIWGIGTVLGPVVGGAFAESKATWRWAFYMNLCVAALFAPVYIWLIPSFKPRPGVKVASLLCAFDFVGTILSVGAIMSLFMAINFGGALYAWGSGQTIALFITSGVLFLGFGIQQHLSLFTSVTDRIFPCRFLGNFNAVLLYICASAINTSAFVPIYYIPLYFQFTRGDDAIKSAVRLLPMIVTLSALILCNGHLMSKFSYFQPWYTAGSVLTVIGGALLWCFVQAGYAVIQAVVSPTDLAYAISFMMLAQLGGIALGLSIAGSIFINKSLAGLSSVLPDIPRSQLQFAIAGTSGDLIRSLPDTLRDQAIASIVVALRSVFVPVFVGGAVCLVVSVFFTQRKLFKDVQAIAA